MVRNYTARRKNMKVELGSTDVAGLPLDETDRIMEGMEQAEKAGETGRPFPGGGGWGIAKRTISAAGA
jgi:hypothetical protein